MWTLDVFISFMNYFFRLVAIEKMENVTLDKNGERNDY